MDDKFKFLTLPNIVEECLDVLSTEMSLPNSYKKLSSNMVDTITELGRIRNATSVSHGSAKRVFPHIRWGAIGSSKLPRSMNGSRAGKRENDNKPY